MTNSGYIHYKTGNDDLANIVMRQISDYLGINDKYSEFYEYEIDKSLYDEILKLLNQISIYKSATIEINVIPFKEHKNISLTIVIKILRTFVRVNTSVCKKGNFSAQEKLQIVKIVENKEDIYILSHDKYFEYMSKCGYEKMLNICKNFKLPERRENRYLYSDCQQNFVRIISEVNFMVIATGDDIVISTENDYVCIKSDNDSYLHDILDSLFPESDDNKALACLNNFLVESYGIKTNLYENPDQAILEIKKQKLLDNL